MGGSRRAKSTVPTTVVENKAEQRRGQACADEQAHNTIGETEMGKLIDWITGKTAREAEVAAQAAAQAAQDVLEGRLNSGQQLKMICGPAGVGLNEEIICVLPETFLSEPRSVRVYHGGSRGASIRVAKGLSFRVFESRGYSESHDEIRTIDQGNFIITKRRVIFSGSQRTITMDLDQIVNIVPIPEGVRINKERRDKPFIFGFDPKLTTIIDGVCFNANGMFVCYMLGQAQIMARY
jgi:hypothetical protein